MTQFAGPFDAWRIVELPGGRYRVADLPALARSTGRELERLPYSIRVLLENALRYCGRGVVEEKDVLAMLDWGAQGARPGGSVAEGSASAAAAAQQGGTSATAPPSAAAGTAPELAFMPARVLLQDFTGVPCVVDLAAMRSALARLGGDPRRINPSVPVDLVIDHSLQVDYAGIPDACQRNMALEMERNAERYSLLRWAQNEFSNLRVVPPGTGICHQVNLEYLAQVVRVEQPGGPEGSSAGEGGPVAHAGSASAGGGSAVTAMSAAWDADSDATARWVYPDTVIGTDSHTTMINGLGVLGWGVGGIEAEAVMLGQPYFMLVPEVVGVRLTGLLPAGATATDLVLTLTELLRKVGVVGRFVEYFGPGAEALPIADRATVANMAPEYGATCGFFPVDQNTITYLRETGRSGELCDRVAAYCRMQGLFREPGSPEPEYSQVVELDLAEVTPSLAGPRRPQDRVPLSAMKEKFHQNLPQLRPQDGGHAQVEVELDGRREVLRDGQVVIASITSCTNTSNPALMLGAGLLARKAVERGLAVPSWVKTSLAPGSRAVTRYLAEAGLLPALESLGFGPVGYGCATCIGNSGPLPEPVAQAIQRGRLVVAAVLSGNRNFEARIHPLVRANYLASPPLVVAFALAGRVDIDLDKEPLGFDRAGQPVFLADIWPSAEEVAALAGGAMRPEIFRAEYEKALRGTEAWQRLAVPQGALYRWDPTSTYVQEPPFFADFAVEPTPPADIVGARILAVLGDSVTTDHISPAGSIAPDSPAGRYLQERGVAPADFNTYGARRGNHEVLLRGAFANVRLRNRLARGREGGWTVHQPSGELLPIYDAAMRYAAERVPLVIFAGKEYGTGSSRDWAAKGTALLGVRAVIAESFERIHRSNLVGMGVLPLELPAGVAVDDLGLDGTELVDVIGLSGDLCPGMMVTVRVRRPESAMVASKETGDTAAGLASEQATPSADTAGLATPSADEAGRVPPSPDNAEQILVCRTRLDSTTDLEYFQHGGVLPRVLRLKLAE